MHIHVGGAAVTALTPSANRKRLCWPVCIADKKKVDNAQQMFLQKWENLKVKGATRDIQLIRFQKNPNVAMYRTTGSSVLMRPRRTCREPVLS